MQAGGERLAPRLFFIRTSRNGHLRAENSFADAIGPGWRQFNGERREDEDFYEDDVSHCSEQRNREGIRVW